MLLIGAKEPGSILDRERSELPALRPKDGLRMTGLAMWNLTALCVDFLPERREGFQCSFTALPAAAPLLGFMDIKELFLLQKQAEHEGTIAVYQKIPRDRLDWRPGEGMLSLGQLIRHAWKSEEGNRYIALDDDWSYYEKRVPQGLFAMLGEVKSLDDELQQIQRVHQDTILAVKVFPLERWTEIRENAKFRTRRPVGIMLFRMIEHQIHHRAQAGTYLRILTGERASPYDI